MRLEFEVDIASAFGMLDWGGSDWPQPKAVLGIGPWDWDELETETSNCGDVSREFYANQIQPWRWYWQRMMRTD